MSHSLSKHQAEPFYKRCYCKYRRVLIKFTYFQFKASKIHCMINMVLHCIILQSFHPLRRVSVSDYC